MAVSSRSIRRGMPAAAILAAASLAVTGPGVPAHAAPPDAVAAASTAKDVQVTLITGDQVTLRGGDPAKASIEPGAGRQKIGFNTYRIKDHAYVIPSDAAKAVGDGHLDRRLFDVTGLIRAGYDDASSSTIPVLATYQGAAKHAMPKGATVTRQLPVIDGAAFTVDKKNAAAFLGTTAVGTARSASGFGKVWLDGRRKLTLDQSVPQIGGPVAWQAGYTGKGVPVAVLDTGIDASHPDLATQVAGEKNFTTEPADDLVGHGTHVASTIAGTGAASDGKYKGVAPDARIYDGKVCEVRGCQDSAILAGMEWAATEVKAKVVNLSLGGPDTPEIDPLEEAVNRLTAQTGTLFVIAAGNEGPRDGTVASPGSADAALTVGAVDKQDHLAAFSSRGPRVGDGALKPDVTAPGVDIVAAKSKDSSIGEPVGDRYLRLSGTSMATPHTAGSAAILLQEHPSWTPAEVKSALMASAKVMADQTSFQQGAGRIDVGVAITQSVIAQPGSVSFGTAAFPHDDDVPITKVVTFRNLGDAPATLNLTSALNGPDGTAAPAGALRLSASSVTVPAGGTASVQATSDTSLGGADGPYSGRITATGSGASLVVPVGVEKEAETYTLTVKLIKPDGTPDSDYPFTLVDMKGGQLAEYVGGASGTVTIRLPKGEYALDQFQEFERAPEDWTFYKLAAPGVQLTSDQTVVLDARKAKVVDTAAPRAGAEQAASDVGYDRWSADGHIDLATSMALYQFGTIYTLGTGPALPANELVGHVTSQWGVPGDDGLFTNTPYLYGLANYQPGQFATGFQRTVKDSELAIVDQTVNATDGEQVHKIIAPVHPQVDGVFVRTVRLDLPRTIRYYLDPAPGGWYSDVQEPAADSLFGLWLLEGDAVNYRAGRTYHEQWNAAALVPSVRTAARGGDSMQLTVAAFTDAEGHASYGPISTDTAGTTLSRDGTEIATSPYFGNVQASGLPAGKASYQLVTTGTQSFSPFSTRMDLTATFTSSGDQTVVPIRTVRYLPDVDDHNLAKRTPVTVLPLALAGTATAPVKKLTVQVSGDGGTTWSTASVISDGTGYKAVFPTPAGTSISLKAQVVDTAGNATTQTVIAAYQLH